MGSSSGIGLAPLDDVVNLEYQHRLAFAHVGGFCKGGIHCGSIWLKDSEGLSETNKQILAEATATIGRLRGPWILGRVFEHGVGLDTNHVKSFMYAPHCQDCELA